MQAQSKPMQAILKRMNLADEFDIVIFGDEVCSPCMHACIQAHQLLVCGHMHFSTSHAKGHVHTLNAPEGDMYIWSVPSRFDQIQNLVSSIPGFGRWY
jgi:hypothetical protein